MNTRTFKVASRALTVLAIGTALTLGGASVAAASSRHGRDGGAQNGWGAGGQYGGQQNGDQNGSSGWSGGHYAKARGDVTAYTAASGATAGSITIKEHDGTSVTFSTSAATTITELGGTGGTLVVGDDASVQAAAATPTVASAIKYHLPAPVSTRGSVTAYTAASGATAGSITIKEHDGTSVTFSTSAATTITELGGTGGTLAVGDDASVQAAAATPTVASAISFHLPAPVITRGSVTAYTAASGTTAGSITIKEHDGTSMTFSTSTATTITEVGGTGATLIVGDDASVQAAAATPTVASAISFRPPQPVIAMGRVTAYTAASGTTAGSITLQGRDGTPVTFSTGTATTITEVGGTGGTLAAGDIASVQAAAATPTVASAVWFFVAPTTGGFNPQNFNIASGSRHHHSGRLDAHARFSLR